MRTFPSTTGTEIRDSNSLPKTVTEVFGGLRETPVTLSTRLDEFSPEVRDYALDVLEQTLVGPDKTLIIPKTSNTIGDLVHAIHEQIAAGL